MEKKIEKELELEMSLLCKGADSVLQKEDLIKKLKQGRPLVVKLGLDPTAPDIHLGHSVVLRKLRQFQEYGHMAVIVLGDFTGRIGDPSGRASTRKQLSSEEVLANAKTYEEQIMKILIPSKTKITFNSEWLGKLSFEQVLDLASRFTVARMLERDDFKKRMEAQKPIGIHEFFYPLIQGYDSVALKADVEIGGTDQTFNVLMGRHLQKVYEQESQVVMLMPILKGTDGIQKMSKSLGNYIGIHEKPSEMFGKVMSIKDEQMVRYYKLVTDLHPMKIDEIVTSLKLGERHPRDVKLDLAEEIVTLYHGESLGRKARVAFIEQFSKKNQPEQMEAFYVDKEDCDMIRILKKGNFVKSNSEARRLIEQGGISLNGQKVELHQQLHLKDGDVLKVGKRRYAKVILKNEEETN